MVSISANVVSPALKSFRNKLSSQILNPPATPLDLKRFLQGKLKELEILEIIEERKLKEIFNEDCENGKVRFVQQKNLALAEKTYRNTL